MYDLEAGICIVREGRIKKVIENFVVLKIIPIFA